MTKPLIYIAGPISKGWLPDNIRQAVEWGERVHAAGGVPFVPHTHGTLWELIRPHDHEFWMELCLAVVPRCDGLLRIIGDSKGADMEVELAMEHGLPVYVGMSRNMLGLAEWIDGFREPEVDYGTFFRQCTILPSVDMPPNIEVKHPDLEDTVVATTTAKAVDVLWARYKESR